MAKVEINFEFPDLGAKLQRKVKEIYVFLAAQMQTNRGFLFDQEGAYNGHQKWAPLKFRRGQILSDRGTLRKSIAPVPARGAPGTDGIVEFAPETVTIGTKLFYAAMMNWGTTKLSGGVLKPVKAKALKIPTDKGPIFRKSVRIPERRFDDWNDQDQREIEEAYVNKIAAVLNE